MTPSASNTNINNRLRVALMFFTLLPLPLLSAFVFASYAEIFNGDKEPMIQMILGFLLGIPIAICLFIELASSVYTGHHKAANIVWLTVVILEICIIPAIWCLSYLIQ